MLASYSNVMRRAAIAAAAVAMLAVLLAIAGTLRVDRAGLTVQLGKLSFFRWQFQPQLLLVVALAAVAAFFAAPSRRARVAIFCERFSRLPYLLAAAAAMAYVLPGWTLAWELLLPMGIAGTLVVALALRALPAERLTALTSHRATAPVLGALGTEGLVALGWWMFRGYPYVLDSSCQWVQAKLLVAGRLWVPAPDLPDFFRAAGMVIADGRWYSQYLPGHVALLALAEWLAPGTAWLVNPLAGGATLWLTARLGERLYDRRTGFLAALLLAISPFFLIMQSEMMNHGTAQLLLLAATYLIVTIEASPRPRLSAFAVGFLGGVVLATRPLTLTGLMLPVAIVGLVRILPRLQRRASVVAAGLAGFAVPVALLLLYNRATTGAALHTAYGSANPTLFRLGFDATFRPCMGVSYSLNNIYSMNEWFLGLKVGSWLPVATFFLLGRRRGADVLLLAMTASLSAAYMLYSYQDFWFGPRFLYEALFAIALLSARGILAVAEALRRLCGNGPNGARLAPRLALLMLLPILHDAADFAVRKTAFFKTQQEFTHLSSLAILERFATRPDAVVFVPPWTPELFIPANMRYPEGPLFPNDLDERNGELMERLAGRKFYRWTVGKVLPIESQNARSATPSAEAKRPSDHENGR